MVRRHRARGSGGFSVVGNVDTLIFASRDSVCQTQPFWHPDFQVELHEQITIAEFESWKPSCFCKSNFEWCSHCLNSENHGPLPGCKGRRTPKWEGGGGVDPPAHHPFLVSPFSPFPLTTGHLPQSCLKLSADPKANGSSHSTPPVHAVSVVTDG